MITRNEAVNISETLSYKSNPYLDADDTVSVGNRTMDKYSIKNNNIL